MKKYLEQLRKALADKQAEIDVIMEKSLSEGVTPSEEDEAKLALLEKEYETIEKNLSRVEKSSAQTEKSLNLGKVEEPAKTHSPKVEVKSNLEKGMAFALAVKASTAAAIANRRSGGGISQLDILKSWNAPEQVIEYAKEKAIGTTTDATFASPLVAQVQGEFIDMLRPKTILGRLKGDFVEVPFNVKAPVQTGGATVGWVGETKVKPNSGLSFGEATLTHSKVAGIVVLSDELVRMSSPKADAIIMNSLQKDIAGYLDASFINPDLAETDDNPASVTNGVAPIPASGYTAADFDADLTAAIEQFIAAGESIDGAEWVMSELLATRIGQARDSLGNKYFDGMQGSEKTLLGLPVTTSANAADKIVLVKTSNILLADDETVDYQVSNEASVTINGELVSLFERNLTGIRAERFIRWKPFRKAAAWIDYSTP